MEGVFISPISKFQPGFPAKSNEIPARSDDKQLKNKSHAFLPRGFKPFRIPLPSSKTNSCRFLVAYTSIKKV